MKYIDADILKAEIERYENTAIDAYNPHGEDADFWHGKVVACEDLKAFVTSLQQKQPEDIPSAGSGAMGTTPPKFKLDVKEQPEELEEEMDEMWLEYCEDVDYLVYASIARHFAEWGARHSINWGDVQLLDTFILELSREEKDGADWGDSEKFYTEVLRRFHEFNDKKIPEIVAEWEAEHLKK